MRLHSYIGMDPNERYFLPHHYLDLGTDEHQLILHFEYVNRMEVVKSLLDFTKIGWILDAGCGTGRFLYEIRDEAVNSVGMDWSERALSFARIFNPLAEFVQGDLMHFRHPAQFDAIVMIEVLEHFSLLQAQIVLENMANHLAAGGRLVVTVPSVNKAVHGDHHRHFDEKTLRETLEPHFNVVEVLGHTRSQGWKTKLWWKCRRVLTWLYPFRLHVKGVTRLLEWLNEVYAARYAVGRPEECNGIIALCEKAA